MIDQEMQHCRKIVRFDPTISTANQGDFIIRNACEHVLHDCFPVQLSVAVPVRDRLSKVSMKHVGSADYAFVCGTNLLSSDMRRQRMWNIRLRDAVMMRCGDLHKRELLNFRLIREKFQRTHVILLGAGWYQYQDEPTGYTKRILKTLLDGQYLHAVRDEYTPAPAEAGHHERAEYGVSDNVGADRRQMRADSDAQGGARRDNADGLPQQPGSG